MSIGNYEQNKRRASIKEALLEGTYLYFKGVYGECNAQALQIWVLK